MKCNLNWGEAGNLDITEQEDKSEQWEKRTDGKKNELENPEEEEAMWAKFSVRWRLIFPWSTSISTTVSNLKLLLQGIDLIIFETLIPVKIADLESFHSALCRVYAQVILKPLSLLKVPFWLEAVYYLYHIFLFAKYST